MSKLISNRGKHVFTLLKLLSIVATVLSLIGTVVYVTWFVASVDKRVTILEQNDVQQVQDFADFIDRVNKTNDDQDEARDEFRSDTTYKLIHLDEKIERIYAILLDLKKNH